MSESNKAGLTIIIILGTIALFVFLTSCSTTPSNLGTDHGFTDPWNSQVYYWKHP